MRRRITIAGIATAAVLAGGGYASYAVGSDAASYRTAAATTGDVESVLSLAGTVQPAGRADLSFATAGTVAKVAVAVGDRVKAGDVLGRLDTGSLANAVTQAQARLASARARLESDKDAQAEAVAEAAEEKPATKPKSASPKTSSPGPSGGDQGGGDGGADNPDGDGGDGGTDGALAALAAEQEAVIAAQSTASKAIVNAKEALAAQQKVCAEAFEGTPDGSDGSEGESAPESAVSTENAANEACATALDAVQDAQDQVSEAQDSLQTALTKLSATLAAAFKALEAASADQPTGGQPTGDQPEAQPETKQPSGEQPAAEAPAETSGQPTGSSPGGSVTAATLATDQASIEQAEADLLAAEQELAMAVVKAPFDGKIVQVNVARGDSVTAGTTAYVLVSEGTMTAEVVATIEQVQQLALGQVARVTPTGATEPITGVVSGIGTLADEDGNYPVTITLDTETGLATGLTASVEVVIGTAKDVVTVPASAIDAGSVQVVDDGVAKRTPVTTGVVGATTVEIKEGLEKGDEVVLADLSEPLPSGDPSSNQLGPGGFGGPGGTVRFGGRVDGGGGAGGGPQVFTQGG